MKKLLLIPFLLFLLTLSACDGWKYEIISEGTVNGYYIYEKVPTGAIETAYFEDIYLSEEDYNYGFGYSGGERDERFFIRKEGKYIYLRQALEDGLITIDTLLPELNQFERQPGEVSSSSTGYHWLDFYINGQPVYLFAGGECDQAGHEMFTIDGIKYLYHASGCLQDHLLYMNLEGYWVSVSSLIDDDTIDGELLIPILDMYIEPTG